MQTNPALSATAFSDPRMIQVIGVLMGVDLQAFDRPEGTADKGGFDPSNPEASAPPSPPPAAADASSSTPAPAPTPKAKAPEPAPPAADEAAPGEPMDVDDDAATKAEAEAVKKAGNEAYKARRFDEAIEKYQQAWELFPKDISFLTNLAGASASCGPFRLPSPPLCSRALTAINLFPPTCSCLLRAGRV